MKKILLVLLVTLLTVKGYAQTNAFREGFPKMHSSPQDSSLMLITITVGGIDSTFSIRKDTLFAMISRSIGGGGSPSGNNTNVQFNNSGSFGGSDSLTWDGVSFNVKGDGVGSGWGNSQIGVSSYSTEAGFYIDNKSEGGQRYQFVSTGAGSGGGVGNWSFGNATHGFGIISGDSLGNVGVGTLAPIVTLDVNGDIRGANIATSPGESNFVSTNEDGILVNTGIPTGTFLDNTWSTNGNTGIDESVNFIGTTDTSSIIFKINGEFAGMLQRVGNTGKRNTSFGSGSQPPAYVTAQNNDNCAFGYNALHNNIYGTDNVAIGIRSSENTGSNGTAGIQGSSNTSVGMVSLLSNNTGLDNVAIGGSALQYDTSSIGNTAVGYRALRNDTLSSYNVALGWHSGETQKSSGDHNTYIGSNSDALNGNFLQYASAIGSGSKVNCTNCVVLGDTSKAIQIGIGYTTPSSVLGASRGIAIRGKVAIVDGTQGAGKLWSSNVTGVGSWQKVGGVYTPTLTNTTNVTSSTPYQCTYTRNDSVVTVTGKVDVVTTAAVATVLTISLPVASNLASTVDLNGLGNPTSAIAVNGYVEGNSTSDTAQLKFVALSIAGSGTIFFTFSYVVK